MSIKYTFNLILNYQSMLNMTVIGFAKHSGHVSVARPRNLSSCGLPDFISPLVI